jgi:hypothetical protein
MTLMTRRRLIKASVIAGIILVHMIGYATLGRVVIYRDPPPDPPTFYGFVPPPPPTFKPGEAAVLPTLNIPYLRREVVDRVIIN